MGIVNLIIAKFVGKPDMGDNQQPGKNQCNVFLAWIEREHYPVSWLLFPIRHECGQRRKDLSSARVARQARWQKV